MVDDPVCERCSWQSVSGLIAIQVLTQQEAREYCDCYRPPNHLLCVWTIYTRYDGDDPGRELVLTIDAPVFQVGVHHIPRVCAPIKLGSSRVKKSDHHHH
jgi:hypothetical protein